MRIATADDKAHIERIVNHSELRKWNSHDGASLCDAAKWLLAPSFVVLVDGGCFLARCVGPCRYDVHTNFLPECRGREALRQAREAMDFAFKHTDAEELYTMVPTNNQAAGWFARATGFRERFERSRVWLQNGSYHDMRYYSITVDDWVLKGPCAKRGRLFHDELHRLAPELDKHAEDPVHDCYVGAAFEMMQDDQIIKGASLYNRWARFAGYATIMVTSKDPLVVDIQTALIKFENGSLAVEVK